MKLIALAQASWWFPHVEYLALFTSGDRKCAGVNWCYVSLYCQPKITATITHSILSVKGHEMAVLHGMV